MKNSKLNRDLARASGWTETENGNWLSPSGEIHILYPDYCGKQQDLAKLLNKMGKKEVTQALLAWKKRK